MDMSGAVSPEPAGTTPRHRPHVTVAPRLPPALPMTPQLPADALARHVESFADAGFTVLPLLSPSEVAALRAAFATDRAEHAEAWTLRGKDHTAENGPVGESGRWQSGDVLHTSAAEFERVVRHPLVLQLVAELIGPAARYRGCSAMWREPVTHAPPSDLPAGYAVQDPPIHWQLWHREAGGMHVPWHPLCIPSLQLIIYLDDCDDRSHCFSVVPESVAEKRDLPITQLPRTDGSHNKLSGRTVVEPASLTGSERMWANVPLKGREGWGERRHTGTDILEPAGTLIVQNNLK